MRLFARTRQHVRFLASVAAVGLIYTLPLLTVGRSDDLFLKVESVDGSSSETNHPDWIDTLMYQTSFRRTIAADPGGKRSAGLPGFEELNVTKVLDKSSPLLMEQAATGTGKDVQLEVIRNSQAQERYFRIKLYDALVSSFTLNGANELTESVSFNYSKIEFTYTEFSKGIAQRESTFWYDIPAMQGGVVQSNLVNQAPTISGINDQITLEDTAVTVAFAVGDPDNPPDSLALSASSSDSNLVSSGAITFGGSGTNRTATILPASNQTGTVAITIHVSDGIDNTSSSFNLEVQPVNDPPTIAAIPPQTMFEGSSLSLSVQIGDVDDLADSLNLDGASSNQSLVPDSSITFSGGGSNRTVTITPVAGQIGDATITLDVFDGALHGSTSFLLTVNESNPQAPTDILLSDDAVPENSPGGTLVGTLSAVDADSNQHTFTLSDSAGGRFRIDNNNQVVVESGAQLDFESASNHVILVKATDPDGLMFSKSLTILVENVNEAPDVVLTDTSTVSAVAGRSEPITRLSVSDVDAGTEALELQLEVDYGTLDLNGAFAGVTANGAGTSLMTLQGPQQALNVLLASTNGVGYTGPSGTGGLDLLRATLNDNGHSGTGGALSDSETLSLRFYRSLYDQWLHQVFTQQELDNPALEPTLWGFHADADNDGLETVAEYGLGTPPRSSLHERPTAVFVDNGGSKFLSLTIQARQDPDLSLAVEVASDIDSANWSSDPADLMAFPPVNLGNGFDRVRFDDQVPGSDASHRFLRMRWTLQNQVSAAPAQESRNSTP